MAKQAENHNTTNSTAPTNVVYLTERLQAKLEKKLPLLQSSGVYLEPTACEKLSRGLNCAVETVVMAADTLSGKLPCPYAADHQARAVRSAAMLYRVSKHLKLAQEQAEKLERKLRKAKKKARHR